MWNRSSFNFDFSRWKAQITKLFVVFVAIVRRQHRASVLIFFFSGISLVKNIKDKAT